MHSALDDDAPALLRTEDAARRLGVSARTMDTWRWRGTGPRYVKLGARVVRYPVDALEEWIAERGARGAARRGGCGRDATS